MSIKPLNRKAYGSIPHLPDSRLGPSDKQANPGHVKILTEKPRDGYDWITVQEKIDGSNVGVAKLGNGQLVPIIRAGHEATSSPYEQHHYWAIWVWENSERFDKLLALNEWCVGEWCIQAHGTRYIFDCEPFFLFDIFSRGQRLTLQELNDRRRSLFVVPTVIKHSSVPYSVADAQKQLEKQPYGYHGALDPIEGFVWRLERKGKVEFLAKYVRPDKANGIYLPEQAGQVAVYNYWEDPSECIKHLKNERLLDERRSGSKHPEGNVVRKRCIIRR